MFDEKSAPSLAIQYGGSVKPDNAAALLSRPGVDGASIGVPACMPRSFWLSSGLGSVSRKPKWDEHYNTWYATYHIVDEASAGRSR